VILRDLLNGQPPDVVAAVLELESRGLTFCVHFGYSNAISRLRSMDEACSAGHLYEWLRDECGILTVGSGKPRGGAA
jgi:hypothetical protein